MDFEWDQLDKALAEKKRWDARAEELAKEAGFTNEEWKYVSVSTIAKQITENGERKFVPGSLPKVSIEAAKKKEGGEITTCEWIVPVSYFNDETGTHRDEYKKTTGDGERMAATGTAMEAEEIARMISDSFTLPGFTMHANDLNFRSYDNGKSPGECFDELERRNKLGPYAEDAESEERKGGVKG
jgi:hypothetical protein